MAYQISFVFSKKNAMRYISHLDLMRLFSRALRRADLPVKITKGFSPHLKISINRALKLGVESEYEEARVNLSRWMRVQDFKIKFQEQLPEGIEVKDVKGNIN